MSETLLPSRNGSATLMQERLDRGLRHFVKAFKVRSLLAAPFKLAERGVVPLAQAWDLVAANPAEAAGLTDRGRFATGLRADAIVVDDHRPGLPRVVAAVVGGRLRHATGHLPLIA